MIFDSVDQFFINYHSFKKLIILKFSNNFRNLIFILEN